MVGCPAPAKATHMCGVLAAFSGLHKKEDMKLERRCVGKDVPRGAGRGDWRMAMSKMHCECI